MGENGKSRLSGISLLECLVTLALVAILATMAAPAWARFTVATQAHAAVEMLRSAIRSGQIQALRQRAPVTICSSEEGNTCESGADWSRGWIALLEPVDQDNQAPVPVLRQQGFSSLTIGKNGHAGRIRIDSRGRITQNQSLFICARRDNRPVHRLVLNRAGRIRVEDPPFDCPE